MKRKNCMFDFKSVNKFQIPTHANTILKLCVIRFKEAQVLILN
jgi:hypothetical protein